MALNVLAGAGQYKRELLESKGVFEERFTGDVQLLGGIFSRKKSGSGTTTPKKEVTRSDVQQSKSASSELARNRHYGEGREIEEKKERYVSPGSKAGIKTG